MKKPYVVATGWMICAASVALGAQDTIRVRADGAPAWGRDVRLVPELTIGRLDGPPEYALGRIYMAAPERSGAVYLFDANDIALRRRAAAAVVCGEHHVELVGFQSKGLAIRRNTQKSILVTRLLDIECTVWAKADVAELKAGAYHCRPPLCVETKQLALPECVQIRAP